jgi:hypothetical protein
VGLDFVGEENFRDSFQVDE